jgi:hypothetical protein
MCLTAAEFYAMPEVHQLQLIVEAAIVLGERREEGFEFVLYNIDGLYIEETRSVYDENFGYFTCIENTDFLLPYTEELSVLVLQLRK